MGLMSLYINGTERACRTKIFTGSATDATLFIHDRESGRIRDSGHGRHHLDGSRRTMTGTVSAFHTVCIHHTILIYEHGMTRLPSLGALRSIHGQFCILISAMAKETANAMPVRAKKRFQLP